MSLRSILGGSSRVKKTPAKSRLSSSSKSSAATPSSPWLGGLPRTKAGPGRNEDGYDDNVLNETLEDGGLAAALPMDPTLRDVPQAMAYAQEHMFSPLPTRGISSTLTATVLNRRGFLPPLLTSSHLCALLTFSTPTTVERETAELVQCGTVRRVLVPRRGAVGEMLILSADLERMLMATRLDEATKDAFMAFLKANPTATSVPMPVTAARSGGRGGGALEPAQVDALLREGFLTSPLWGQEPGSSSVFSRPEDRTTLVSLVTVARAASGTFGAVGGEGALLDAGGSGGGPSDATGSSQATSLNITVPGAGAFLKLVSAALQHLTFLLDRLPHRECPEYLLCEHWDGGTAKVDGASGRSRHSAIQEAARLARGERIGTPPGRTKKWKEFSGLRFEWVLAEAVGAGLVEVFETGSVGRGVRLVR